MGNITFNQSPEPTIGVELEIQLLDTETLELASRAPEILARVRPDLSQKIKPEFIQSMVEINTGICANVAEVESDLKESWQHLQEIAGGLGTALYSASLHPFSRHEDQTVSDHPRYRKIMDELQITGRRFITQGLHVHIGIHDEEMAIKVYNNMRIYLPVLLALTTSSPFFESEDTGLMSYRSKLFEALPLAGMPDSMSDWEDFENLCNLMMKSGIIESVKDIWWDVRPHPDFGTIEVRVCDLPSSLNDILAVTALIQALVIAIGEQYENPEPHMQILRSNRWQAARYGLDGFYVDPFFARKYTMAEAALNLYRHVRPVAEMLESTDYLDGIQLILDRRTSAHLQKDLYISNGSRFPEMIRSVQERFLK